MPVPDEAQARAHELYMSYTRGWADAAAIRSVDKKFENHPTRQDLKDAYLAGYSAGYKARRDAHETAVTLFGYQPNILRLTARSEERG